MRRFRTLRTFLTLGVVPGAGLVSCSSPTAGDGGDIPPAALAVEKQPLPDSVLRQLYSGIPDRRRLVIRDAPAWAALWNEAASMQHPQPPLPHVNFAQQMLIVATMGTRPSGGHSIEIDGVYAAGGRLHVAVREVAPAASCGTTGALTAPVMVVRVARSDAPVVFVERSEVRDCS